MKQKFLDIVKEVKDIGIVGKLSVLYDNSDKEGFKAAWQKFSDDNPDLFEKIKDWASEFKDSKCEEIFAAGESFENPMEITVCIFIIGNGDVSECEIFGEWEELIDADREQGDNFAQKVADFADNDMICNISIEDIFNDNSDEDEEPEDCDDSDSDEKADAEDCDATDYGADEKAEDCNDSDSDEDVADDEEN